jgi:hypothetical protein
MMSKRRTAVIAGLSVWLLTAVAQAEVFVYPKQGQSQDQFGRDQYECHNWAQGQTGFNPSQPAAAAAPAPQQGGAIRGGARGAALGAVGGAIGGDAGKGAAIGAGVGATAGLMRQSSQNRQAAQAAQQQQAAQQANLQRYDQAYGACMGGRGYQVK